MNQLLFQTSPHKPDPYQVAKIRARMPANWHYLHFTDPEICNYFHENPLTGFEEITQKFHSIAAGAHKADLFRYYFLYQNGGIYLDSDVLLTQSVEDVIADCDFSTVLGTLFPGTVFNGFLFSASPGNPILLAALKHLYSCDPECLQENYFYTCAYLYELVTQNTNNLKLKLFREAWYTDKSLAIVDDSGCSQMIHYWIEKQVPRSARIYYLSYFFRKELWSLARHYSRKLAFFKQ